MKTLKVLSLMFIASVIIMGCSGNYAKLKTQSKSDSKVTQQELIDNWSDYNIWVNYIRAPYIGFPEKVVNYIKFRSERILATLNCTRLEYQLL